MSDSPPEDSERNTDIRSAVEAKDDVSIEVFQQQLEDSLKRCLEVAKAERNLPHTHSAPDLGGDDLDIHLDRVIPYFDHLLEHVYHSQCENQVRRGGYLLTLASVYKLRFRRNGRSEDRSRADELAEAGAKTLDDSYKAEKDYKRTSLANQQLRNYQKTQSPADLERAIESAYAEKAATASINNGDCHRAKKILADALYQSYNLSGNPEHLNDSIHIQRRSLPLRFPGDKLPDSELAAAYFARFMLKGAEFDLRLANRYAKEALEGINEGHPAYAGLLSNLALTHDFIWRTTGSKTDLNIAVKLTDRISEMVVPGEMACALYVQIGILMRHKFEASGDSTDINKAIQWLERAVDAMRNSTPTDPKRYIPLYSLGIAYSCRHRARDASPSDLSEDLGKALALFGDELKSLPAGDSQSDLLFTSVDKTMMTIDPKANPRDLDKAFELFNKIRLSSGHRPVLVISGGKATVMTNKPTASEDLEKAIVLFKEAIESLPADHMGRPQLLFQMGKAIMWRSPTAYEDPISLFTEVMDNDIACASTRVDSASELALLHLRKENWPEAARCSLAALDLLPILSPRSLQRDDQQHMLSRFSGLPACAAVAALQSELSTYEALRRLEQGRGIIMSFTIDLRSDISSLKTMHPNLFHEFHELRAQIGRESSGLEDMDGVGCYFETGSENKATLSQETEDRRQGLHNLCVKLGEKMDEIRRVEGYDRFLLSPSEKEVMKLAKDGAIVIMYSIIGRSDAFIVTKSHIRQIRLLDLVRADIRKNIDGMNEIFAESSDASRNNDRDKEHPSDNNRLSELLLWLWNTAVNPVCQELSDLGLTGKPKKKLKRVWWIGVGPLSRAPFHAAGDHSRNCKSNTISNVKSSYIPNMKALAYTRQDAGPSNGKDKLRIELIAMQDTPGYKSLPNVENEIKHIEEIASKLDSVVTEKLTKPPKQQVLQYLRRNCGEDDMRIVHFACHGISDLKNPLESHVLLLKDTNAESPQADRLTVREVSSMTISNAYLALLGACHTANNPVRKLADEGLHIVSSFQLAGFRNVIGNMWKAQDEECTTFSKAFYEHLLKSERRGRNEDDVADAYHHALMKVRKESPKDFIGWIPFVHSGA